MLMQKSLLENQLPLETLNVTELPEQMFVK